MPERPVRPAARRKEIFEKFYIMKPERLDGGREDAEDEINPVEHPGDDDANEAVARHAA